MKKYIDFSFDKMNFLAILVLVLSFLWVKVCNIPDILENTIYENVSILPLILGIFICIKSKNHKVFFNFVALILFLAIAREFSYGRVPFCAIEGSDGHKFYSWSHYKYGFLAHIFVGIYITFGILYALINKIWVDIIEIFKKVPIPFWSFLITFICIIIEMYCERYVEAATVEEIMEAAIYTLTFVIIFIYYKKLNNN